MNWDNAEKNCGFFHERRIDMRKLIAFNHVTLDGYFVDKNGDMSWAKADHQDAEWNAFVAENASGGASGGGVLVFGRVTYELMAGFWPTPFAIENMPEIAKAMNSMAKIVFSRTLEQASWNNTTLVKGDLAAEIRKMKQKSEEGMTILGSGSIVSQLAPEELIDEYQIVVNPIVLGEGRTMFEGIKEKLSLKRTKTRAFRNGNVLLCYEPMAR
jgi:dihydrofolate reductase